MNYTLNGQKFDIMVEHIIGEICYPRTWFQNEENRDALGITEEADPILPVNASLEVPQTITMRQCRIMLLNRGMLNAVNVAISGLSMAAQIEWEYSNEVQRNNPLIGLMMPILGLTSVEIDELFIEAIKL